MSIHTQAWASAALFGAAGAALGLQPVRVGAEDHVLHVIAGLATIDARATWWESAFYDNHGPSCKPPPPALGGWWHCDDGEGRPALDLSRADGSVTDPGVCPPEESVGASCGAKVFFQAYNEAPSAPLVAKIADHATSCSGVSVRLYHPEDQVNWFARFEFVHMSEGAVDDTFLILDGWAIWELGRLKYPDCGVPAHLHQSGGPEGTVLIKNESITESCVPEQYCYFGPTGDHTNNWMHEVYWTTPDPPTPTPAPGGSGGGSSCLWSDGKCT